MPDPQTPLSVIPTTPAPDPDSQAVIQKLAAAYQTPNLSPEQRSRLDVIADRYGYTPPQNGRGFDFG